VKIVVDECLPKQLCKLFQQYDINTVPQLGLAGFKDSELLDELDVRKN